MDRWVFQALQKLNSSSELDKKRVNNGNGSCSERQTFFPFLSSHSLCQGDFPFKLPLPCFLWHWDAIAFERPIPYTLKRGWSFLCDKSHLFHIRWHRTNMREGEQRKEIRFFLDLHITSLNEFYTNCMLIIFSQSLLEHEKASWPYTPCKFH